MITLTQLATSTEPVQLQVRADSAGTAYNPTGDPVAVAILPDTSPAPASTSAAWNAATWETDPGNPPTYWATLLVGPLNGGVTLSAGTYICYVKVTDNPAVPIRPGAYLILT
jgi:hypothetical protein